MTPLDKVGPLLFKTEARSTYLEIRLRGIAADFNVPEPVSEEQFEVLASAI